MRARPNLPRRFSIAASFVLVGLLASPAHAVGYDVAHQPATPTIRAGFVVEAGAMDIAHDRSTRGAEVDMVLNGGFSAQPNPLAFWTNAPGAFATWISDGANGSQGSVNVRFLPPLSTGVPVRGAVYYTGLTQCVAIPRFGRYLLRGFARVPVEASPSSFAGLGWTLHANSSNCASPSGGNGRVSFPRSTTWTASSTATIDIRSTVWTPDTAVEIQIQVGDSSTLSIEPVEAFVDEISLIEGPLFEDGFED